MITILVPTFNENQNIYLFVNTINSLNLNFDYNILFVDDNSNDGTLAELIKVKNKYKNINYIVRNEKNRDLTQSVVYAINHIKSKYTMIMDCDLQHDHKKINVIINNIINNNYDLVIGSRFIKNGQNILMNKKRIFESKLGIILCKFLGVYNIRDPLSGFFIIKSELLINIKDKIKTRGFKILLTILCLYKNKLKHKEIPIKFNKRMYEASKLNLKVKILFLEQILRLKFNY